MAEDRAAEDRAAEDRAAEDRAAEDRAAENRPAGAPELTGRLDLSEKRTVHVVGIGGAGMSAIATVLAQMGHTVSGSDLKDSPTLERLRLLGIHASVGHAADAVPMDADAVVISTAIPPGNPEVVGAREHGIPILRRADALVGITLTRQTIAVAGSHGKTTTASMLALILRAAELSPSFVIGGELNEVGTNAAFDDGDWLVVEADESDGTFLALDPAAGIITNVEADHLEHFGGLDALVASFETFADNVDGPLLCCSDDPVAAEIAERHGGVTYGFSETADYRGVDYHGGGTGSWMRVERRSGRAWEDLGELELPVPGRHNAVNALGAAALALEIDVPFGAVAGALSGFGEWPVDSSSGGHARVSPSSTTTPTFRAR
ncbi:MAG: Mur ligase domain-containing protein [Acidimicrobiia bacterium]|nr:Mur ligase domain-containing protein [Acidimicrobiia bacterium]